MYKKRLYQFVCNKLVSEKQILNIELIKSPSTLFIT